MTKAEDLSASVAFYLRCVASPQLSSHHTPMSSTSAPPAIPGEATRQGWLEVALDRLLAGLAAAGVILAVIFQPLMRFADPKLLLGGGILLTLSIGTTTALRSLKFNTSAVALNLVTVILGVLTLAVSAYCAADLSDANDLRCSAIQNAMLRPNLNTRDDLPDVFQALGCRPQGVVPALRGDKSSMTWDRGPPPEPEEYFDHRSAWVANEIVLTRPD